VRAATSALGALFLVVGVGCSLPVSHECEIYMACQAHYDETEGQAERNVNMFRAEGVCWESEELADECTVTCLQRTEELHDLLVESEDEIGPCVSTAES